MTDTKKRLCYHPSLVPTEWNQPRPEPAEVYSCKCGRTWGCPVCGQGEQSWPHDCDESNGLFEAVREKTLKDYAPTWQALADT